MYVLFAGVIYKSLFFNVIFNAGELRRVPEAWSLAQGCHGHTRPAVRPGQVEQTIVHFCLHCTLCNNLALLRITICKIHMFLGLSDPDPLVRDTDPDPSIIK